MSHEPLSPGHSSPAPLESRIAQQPLHRIGRWPDPWQPPDWAHAHTDGTFGNRSTIPRPTTASSTPPAGASVFLETLARFRPDLTLLAEFARSRARTTSRHSARCRQAGGKRLIGTAKAVSDSARRNLLLHQFENIAVTAVGSASPKLPPPVHSRPPANITTVSLPSSSSPWPQGVYWVPATAHSIETWAIFEPSLCQYVRRRNRHQRSRPASRAQHPWPDYDGSTNPDPHRSDPQLTRSRLAFGAPVGRSRARSLSLHQNRRTTATAFFPLAPVHPRRAPGSAARVVRRRPV